MDARDLTRKDLEPFIGSRARVAEVLNRVQPLSLEMIRRLSTGLGIPAEVLIQPYDVTRAALNHIGWADSLPTRNDRYFPDDPVPPNIDCTKNGVG